MGTLSSVNILFPSDISELLQSEGLHPRRMTLQPWATHRETRKHSKGVFLKSVPHLSLNVSCCGHLYPLISITLSFYWHGSLCFSSPVLDSRQTSHECWKASVFDSKVTRCWYRQAANRWEIFIASSDSELHCSSLT